MSRGNVTIKNTTHASIVAKAKSVATISRVKYTVEEYNKFEKSLVTIARSVVSDHNRGQHGYAGLILETASYHTCKTNKKGNVYCNCNGRRDSVSQGKSCSRP